MTKNDFYESMIATFAAAQNREIKENEIYNAYIPGLLSNYCRLVYQSDHEKYKNILDFMIVEDSNDLMFDLCGYNQALNYMKQKYKRKIMYDPIRQSIYMRFSGKEICEILEKHSNDFITDMANFCVNIINELNGTLIAFEFQYTEIKTNRSNQKTIS